ncbi:MAG: hypothetical protein KA981_11310 [Bacteroidia bacterium]|nr:hypothetical protein [Bacteroidia bacterium]
MELNTKDNGLETIDRGMESSFGQMELNIKVTGQKTKLQVRVSLLMLMETFTKVIGKTIRQMVMEYTFIQKPEQNIKGIGRTTCNMVLAFKYIQTATNTRECLNKEKEMVRVHIILLKVKFIKGNGVTAK